MVGNICQNPKCCEGRTKDRWNKKLEAYQSRKYRKSHNDIWEFMNIFANTLCVPMVR